MSAGGAAADGFRDVAFARQVEGAYLAIQQSGSQRVLSLDRGGNVSQVAEQQITLGFTVGLGSWQRTGRREATAQLIDFDFDLSDGTPAG